MVLMVFGNTPSEMSWVRYQTELKDSSLAYAPLPQYKEPASSASSPSPSSSNRISPALLFIIVILAVLFLISGLLHLLVRFLTKSQSSSRSSRYPEISSSDALQRQLQQLFHLNDSGLDQALIDALPVFHYKEILGAQEPFDCAVCLSEFSEKDKLRLLPLCSHAFHLNCIDTWLQSNSTCPLCRSTLFTPGFPLENPIFDFDDIREDDECPTSDGGTGRQKTMESKDIAIEKGILQVRLGKFKRLDGPGEAGGETSSSKLDARRCFSMGSYQYVLGNSDLKVALSHDRRPPISKLAKELEPNENLAHVGDIEGKKISNMTKGESFSVSKIWLWSKKGKLSSNSQSRLPSSLNVDLPWMAEQKNNER